MPRPISYAVFCMKKKTSGWHTAAMTMRLFVQTLNFAMGAIGLGVDELRWPNAVRPGAVLTVAPEILILLSSRPRPPNSTLFPYTTLFRSLTLSNLKLLRRITRTENILHRNFTRRQEISMKDEIGRAVQQECRDRSRMPSSA